MLQMLPRWVAKPTPKASKAMIGTCKAGSISMFSYRRNRDSSVGTAKEVSYHCLRTALAGNLQILARRPPALQRLSLPPFSNFRFGAQETGSRCARERFGRLHTAEIVHGFAQSYQIEPRIYLQLSADCCASRSKGAFVTASHREGHHGGMWRRLGAAPAGIW